MRGQTKQRGEGRHRARLSAGERHRVLVLAERPPGTPETLASYRGATAFNPSGYLLRTRSGSLWVANGALAVAIESAHASAGSPRAARASAGQARRRHGRRGPRPSATRARVDVGYWRGRSGPGGDAGSPTTGSRRGAWRWSPLA